MPPELADERLDRVVAVLGDISRAAARRLVDEGAVTVDGEPGAARDRVTEGQTIAFPLPDPEPGLIPEPVAFTIVHEDDDLIVVDKPAGMVVHPGAGRSSGTLAGGILHRFPQVEGIGQEDRWGIVHRLDRDTSGLLVVALTQDAYAGLVGQIGRRAIRRGYLALVEGGFEVPTGTIDAPIARDHARPTRRRVAPEGRPSRTHYEMVEKFPVAGVTLLSVTLETGRTHQIRVHMAAIGHPLVGDRIYRGGPDRVDAPRLFLHAAELGFEHPVSGKRIEVGSALPTELAGVLDELRERDR